MPLVDTGPTSVTLIGVNTRSLDQHGQVVVISTTQEAIDDFGWGVIMPMASRKYDDGMFDSGFHPTVRVNAADCRRWLDDNA